MIKIKQKIDSNVLRDLDILFEDHKKKHGDRKMNDKKLKRLLGL